MASSSPVLALHHALRRALVQHSPYRVHVALVIHEAVAALAIGVTTGVWLLGGAEGDWIVWPLLGIGGVLAAHAVCHEHVTLGRR